MANFQQRLFVCFPAKPNVHLAFNLMSGDDVPTQAPSFPAFTLVLISSRGADAGRQAGCECAFPLNRLDDNPEV
jgi:hypothetical protein